jgi:hypothetical protein
MKKLSNKKFIKNNSGMLIADFLFAFVMVIGVGIFMFALTFSLATIEVSQYIVWSTARYYAAGQLSDTSAPVDAAKKFEALAEQFPLLTNSEGSSSWFELSKEDLIIGELDVKDPTMNFSSEDKINGYRQPWTGVSTTINLKLFSSLNIPFLGKVALDKTAFKFPVRAFLIRNVSHDECKAFFNGGDTNAGRYFGGMVNLEDGKLAPAAFGPIRGTCASGYCGEDNGC